MSRSTQLFEIAKQCIPGGVNSPVRAFKGVGGTPLFFKSGQGSHVTDVDSQTYIDYVGSWGPLILGHCHPEVVAAVENALRSGMSFGAPTELEIKLAQKIISLMPHLEKVRMVSSGTEATMTAIRLASAISGKSKFIKFNGCYHGHSDRLLVKAGSGLLTLGIPACPGIPASITEHTLTAEFNDLDSVAQLFERYPHEIGSIILEPVPGNMGMIMPKPGFLKGLRELCDKHHALLIFDEVMTGFRIALGGAVEVFNVQPDLTTLGKVIGGGMPVAAIGGKAAYMDYLAPVGAVYQAGTLSGNPLAMAAGLSTLEILSQDERFGHLTSNTSKFVEGLRKAGVDQGIQIQTQSLGGMFGFCFTSHPVENYADVAASDESLFKRFFHGMLKEGVYFAPSMYEAGFVSTAHTQTDFEATWAASAKVLSQSLL